MHKQNETCVNELQLSKPLKRLNLNGPCQCVTGLHFTRLHYTSVHYHLRFAWTFVTFSNPFLWRHLEHSDSGQTAFLARESLNSRRGEPFLSRFLAKHLPLRPLRRRSPQNRRQRCRNALARFSDASSRPRKLKVPTRHVIRPNATRTHPFRPSRVFADIGATWPRFHASDRRHVRVTIVQWQSDANGR